MALSAHRSNTHQQPSRQQQKCGHGPQMVRTEPQTGMEPWDVGTEPHAGHTRRWKWNVSPWWWMGTLVEKVVGWMYVSTPIPPLGLSPWRPKQDKCLQEEEIGHRTGEKLFRQEKRKNRRELRIPTLTNITL